MQLRVGTSGFSYKEWKGSFYPEDVGADGMLGYYASKLTTVEINNTFYRLPKESVLEGWAAQVPDDFRFAIKASRRITHNKRLKDAGDETEYLFRVLAALGPKLGCVLFQLPPNLKLDVERLDAFLKLLPPGARCAFEFRHDTWYVDEVYDKLRAGNHALVMADTEDAPVDEIISTADWGYVRLRAEDYETKDLKEWSKKIRGGGGEGWKSAFVFFKHEGEGDAPRLAADLLKAAK